VDKKELSPLLIIALLIMIERNAKVKNEYKKLL